MEYSLYMCLKNKANIALRRHIDRRSLMVLLPYLLVLLVVRGVEIPHQTDFIQDKKEVSIYLSLDKY